MARTGGSPVKARRGQREGLEHGERLHPQEQPSLVRTVGHQPGEGADDQHRPELRRREQPEGEAAVRQLEHQQRLRDQRQPVPDLGDELAGEEQSEVADPEGVEGLVAHPPEAAHGRPPETRASRTSSAAASRSRSAGAELADAAGEPGRLALAGALEQGAAGSRHRDPDEPPVAGIHGALDQADRLQLGHDLGDGGRRDLLVIGQGPEGERALTFDDRERGQLARGEPGIGLLPQPAGEAGGAQPQPRRQLLVGLRGRRSGRAAGRRGHDLYFTNLISLSNHHPPRTSPAREVRTERATRGAFATQFGTRQRRRAPAPAR